MKTTAKSPDKSLPQQAEAYDFTRDLRVDSYLDVKDTASAWCLAQVTKSAAGQIVVHYDGWGTKYDEVLVYDS